MDRPAKAIRGSDQDGEANDRAGNMASALREHLELHILGGPAVRPGGNKLRAKDYRVADLDRGASRDTIDPRFVQDALKPHDGISRRINIVLSGLRLAKGVSDNRDRHFLGNR